MEKLFIHCNVLFKFNVLPKYKVYAFQMLPSASCKYCKDTWDWADIHIWNWTGLGEARMPASSFGFFVQGSFLLKLPTTLVVHMRGEIILGFTVG